MGGSADGVITGASFAADGTTLTITRSVGANIVVNVPALLRASAVPQPTVNNQTANYTLLASDMSNTVRLTGGTARTFTLPDITGGVQIGDIVHIINDATANLTLDGNGADTIDGSTTLTVYPNESVTLQVVTSTRWDLLSDTTSGEPLIWADIPNGTPIPVGHVVVHGGAFFGCITQHNKGSVGPDGDAANWTLLSNWRGDWSNAWYPVGAFVRDAGVAWIAGTAVVLNDPRPSASNNVKWLRLGSSEPTVVIASSNTAIPASARGNTYVHTGSSNITYTLPAASGGGAVPNGWEVVVSNQGAGDLTIDGNGSDTIDGEATLLINTNGRSVRLQKIANSAWATIADTKDESGGADLPTVVNVSVNTAIPDTAFGDTYRVTGNTARNITLPDPDDVALGWYVRIANGSGAGVDHNIVREGAGQSIEGGTGPLAVRSGESVTIQKVNANEWELIADTSQSAAATGGALSLSTALTDAAKKAWRAHFGSSSIGLVANALPAVANHNVGDTLVIGRGGATVVPFREIDAPATELTATVAGDVMMLLGAGWTRIGNFFSGGVAAAAARAVADANAVRVNRMTVFETAIVNPPGIPGNDFPEYLGLSLANKIDPRRIISIRVRIGGQQVAASVDTATLAPFNDLGSGELTQPGRGGILNLTLGSAARANLKNAVSTNVQYVEGEIEYKFEGTSLQPDVLPDLIDRFHFGTNNNGYPAIVGLTQAQVDARIAALARTLTAKTATAGASRTWTYTLDAADTEIWIGLTAGSGTDRGTMSRLIPRGILTSTAQNLTIDSRVPAQAAGQDTSNAGVQASISGNTLTLSTNQYLATGTPVVYSK